MTIAEMNKWGGGLVHCIGCCGNTPTPVYVGRLRCCKLRVGLCQACKPNLSEAGFKSPTHAMESWARSHVEHCEHAIMARAASESEKWGPKAKELYLLLATTLHDFNAETEMPAHGTETALILLCQTFCNSTGIPTRVFAENLVEGIAQVKAKRDADAAAAKEVEPNLGIN